MSAEITRIELNGGRCGHCGKRFKAEPPDGMPPGTPFGANIHALLLYLHHGHHVGFERLSLLLSELFGLTISEGAIAPPSSSARSPKVSDPHGVPNCMPATDP